MGIYSAFNTFSTGVPGRYAVLFLASSTLTTEQLLDESPQYYPGSMVEFEESIEIESEVVDASIVDIDNEWYEPHNYLGSVQLFGLSESGDLIHTDSFFLNSVYHKISRRQSLTIVSDPAIPIAELGGGNIFDCNFSLVPAILVDLGQPLPINGGLELYKYKGVTPAPRPALKFKSGLIPTPLLGRPYRPIIKKIGLLIKPGVRLLGIKHVIQAVGGLSVKLPALPSVICQTAPPPCDEQYAAYLADNPNAFQTFAQCEAARLNPPPGTPPSDTAGTCIPDVWVCPTDPTFVRPAFTIQYGN